MELAHTRRGSGPALVVLQHYAGRDLWRPVVELLAYEREVWSVDLAGFGGSPLAPVSTLAPPVVAEAVAAWFAETGPDLPQVVGVSYAGAVALELARAGAVSSATAISPLGFWTAAEAALVTGSVGMAAASMHAPWTGLVMRSPWGRRLFGLQLVAHPSRLPRDVAAAASRAIAANRLVFHAGFARAIVAYRATPFDPALPVTIAWGDRDRITPPAQARRAEQLLPGARHVTLTGCGHVPTYDDPEQVACAVLGARAA